MLGRVPQIFRQKEECRQTLLPVNDIKDDFSCILEIVVSANYQRLEAVILIRFWMALLKFKQVVEQVDHLPGFPSVATLVIGYVEAHASQIP